MNRKTSSVTRNLKRLHLYAWWFLVVFFKFKEPIKFLVHYIRREALPKVELRSGVIFHLSDHIDDVTTVFVIFVKRDYGSISSGSVVVDIGANIGVFTLLAASHGARKVISVEPNVKAYNILLKNVEKNHYQGSVNTYRRAAGSVDDKVVRIPEDASPYNRVGDAGDAVLTISLENIINSVGRIDLLKIDCEGAEYEILFSSPQSLAAVKEIRMEYHDGRQDELIDFLKRCGFYIKKRRADGPSFGMLWACRH